MLLRRSSGPPPDEHLDMTPMVDVVFQILIFLMLTWDDSPESAVELPPAVHGAALEGADTVVLTITEPPGPGQPSPVFEGISVAPETRLDGPEAIERVVRAGLQACRRRVVLQAAGDVPHGEVLRVAGSVAAVEGITLHIGVQDAGESG